MFLSLPDFDKAPTGRGDAMIHDGTWPVEAFSTPSLVDYITRS